MDTKKIERLNKQHEKESKIYDKARAFSDIDPITAISVKDVALYKDKTIMLDVATGTGRVAERFRGKVKAVIGLDISKDMLKVAQDERRIDVGFIGPGESTPFVDSTFDLIYCRSALHYMDQKRAIEEWVRISRDNAWIVIGDASFDNDTINRWYQKLLKVIYKEIDLVYHKEIIRHFHKLGQKRTDYKIHMMRGSLNDILVRKHVDKKGSLKAKKMLDEAPKAIKDVMKIHKEGTDYIFDVGWTTTRCHIKK